MPDIDHATGADKSAGVIIAEKLGPPATVGMMLPLGASADAWAARITTCWRASVEAIRETGCALIAAKEGLPHGEFGRMIESALPFSPRTAERLMAIAADWRLANPTHASLLPPSWTTLYELTKLSDDQFENGVRNGHIRPDMERKDVNGARAIMASRQQAADDLDFAPTPPWATRALIEVVLPSLEIQPVDLASCTASEPACGGGHIAEVLREYFAEVHAADVHDYGYGAAVRDFLATDLESQPDWIITNPPFRDLAEKFALRALAQAKFGVAIFARLQWLETIGRYERLFKDQPPTLIAFFCERVALHMGAWNPDGGTATAYIWLVWIKERAPRAPFWIPPGQQQAFTRRDDRERFAGALAKRSDLLEVPAFLRRSRGDQTSGQTQQ